MADILGTDEFLINRDDVTYTQEQATLMANLETDDLLLVNRADKTYTVTGGELIESVIDPLSLTVTIAPSSAYIGQVHTATPVVSGGKIPDGGYVFTYQWIIADDAAGTNASNIAGETGSTYTPVASQEGKYLGCTCTTTDFFGTSATGTTYIGPVSLLAQAPEIDSILLTETVDGQNRYTSKEFPFATTMDVDGEPAPTYKAKVRLSGTTFDFDVKSAAITDVEGGGIKTCETSAIQDVSGTAPNITLTFPNNTGFDCFETDDVVQGIDGSNTYKTYSPSNFNLPPTTLPSDWSFIEQTTISAGPQKSESYPIYVYEFVAPLRNVQVGYFGTNTDFVIKVWGSNDAKTWTSLDCQLTDNTKTLNTGSTSYKYICLAKLSETGETDKCSLVTQNTSEAMNMQNTSYGILSNQSTPVKITDKNANANPPTITVDGGDWDDSDKSQLWSSYLTNANNPELAFNGSFESPGSDNVTVPGSVEVMAFQPATPITVNTSFRFYHKTSDITTKQYRVNGGAFIETPNNLWVDTGFTGTLSLFEFGDNREGSGGGIFAIEIDGKLLIDPVNDSQVWSNNLNGGYNGSTNSDAFNGSTTNFSEGPGGVAGETYAPLEVTFSPALSYSETLEVYTTAGTPYTRPCYPNGESGNATDLGAGWTTVRTVSGPTALNKLTVEKGDSQTGIIAAIRLDGVYLVDAGIDRGLGDDKLVKETPYDIKLTVATNANFDALTDDVFMTDGSSPLSQESYKLVTTDIESVSTTNWSQYGDAVGGQFGESWSAMFSNTDLPKTYDPTFDISSLKLNDAFIPVKTSDANLVGQSVWDATATGGITVDDEIIFVCRPDTAWFTTTGANPGGSGFIKVNGNTVTLTNTGETTNNYQYAKISSASLGGSFNKLEFACSDEGSLFAIRIWGFYVDGNLFLDNQNILTFPGAVSTNPDLRYFKEGDVVQPGDSFIDLPVPQNGTLASIKSEVYKNGSITGSTGCYWYTLYVNGSPLVTTNSDTSWNNALDGDTSTQVRKMGSQTLTLDSSIANVTKLQLKVAKDGDVEKVVFTVTDSASNDETVEKADLPTKAEADSSVDVTVISTGYPNSNTMTVDGGAWNGSDGSGSGVPSGVTWSTGVSGISNSYPASNLFNEDSELFVASPSSQGTITWTSPVAFPAGSKLEVLGWNQTFNATVNGGAIQSFNAGDWTELNYESGDEAQFVVTMKTLTGSANTKWKGVRVNGQLLVDGNTYKSSASNIEYQTNGGEGSIVKVNSTDRTILVTNSGDDDNRWIIGATDEDGNAGNSGETGDAANAKNFYVAPDGGAPIQTTEAWGVTRIASNKLEVTGIQKDEPTWTDATDIGSKDYTVKFPATFGTGNAPDTDLPDGTAISVWVQAKNSEGDDAKESNVLTPADVNPTNAAGPITDSTETTIEVASAANLDTFSVGADLVMINSTGSVANYTMQTSTIESVVVNNYAAGGDNTNAITAAGGVGDKATWDSAFNGVITGTTGATGAQPSINTSMSWTGNIEIPAGKSVILYYFNQADGNGTITVNGQNVPIEVVSGGGDWNTGTTDITTQADTAITEMVISRGALTSGSGIGIAAVEVDGTILVDGQSILTFTDPNPDLKFFRRDDVVQGSSVQISGSWNNTGGDLFPTDALNSNITANNSTVQVITATYSSPLSCNGTFRCSTSCGGSKSGSVKFNDEADSAYRDFTITGASETWNVQFTGVPTSITKIHFRWNGDGTPSGTVYNLSLDGTTNPLIVPRANPSTVVSRDLVNNTMTVDGGNWDASNQSQVWSSVVTVNNQDAGLPLKNAFDGDTSTLAAANAGNDYVLNFGSLFSTTPVKLEVWSTNAIDFGFDIEVDGVSKGSAVNNWVDCGTTTFTTITAKASTNGGCINAIRVDGKILIDAVNDDVVWSNLFTSPNAFVQPKENAFDGDTTTPADTQGGWTLDLSGVTFGTGDHTVTVISGGATSITVNSTALTDPGGAGVKTWTGTVNGEINTIFSSTTDASCRGIYIDDKLLVDKGVDRGLGDTKVTYGPVTGTAKFASTNNTDTLTVTDSNDRWIDNTNRLGTEFYVKDKLKRGLNADSATDRAKLQAIEDAFDNFAVNVASRSAHLASIFARLVEGQSVSEAEVSVLTAAIQDEINIEEPFALDGYYPLYITAAKAEAASSLNSYHTHTIDGDTYYMPDGGTIYHGSYTG